MVRFGNRVLWCVRVGECRKGKVWWGRRWNQRRVAWVIKSEWEVRLGSETEAGYKGRKWNRKERLE